MGRGMGGHGGLNILPGKSWHVYNFEARDKVERDEAAAAEAEAAEVEARRAAARRFRHDALLARAGALEGGAEPPLLAAAELASALAAPPSTALASAALAAPPSRGAAAAAPAAPEDGCPVGSADFSGAGAPWYAQPRHSLHAPRAAEESLPARVRREREALEALRGRPAPPPPPAPAAPRLFAPVGRRSIEELRAERLRREAAEAERAAALVSGTRAAPAAAPPDDRRYHGSFGNAPPKRRRVG